MPRFETYGTSFPANRRIFVMPDRAPSRAPRAHTFRAGSSPVREWLRSRPGQWVTIDAIAQSLNLDVDYIADSLRAARRDELVERRAIDPSAPDATYNREYRWHAQEGMRHG